MTHARKLLTFDFWLDVRVIGILLMVLALGSATFGYVRVHGEFDLLTILGDFYANVSAELGSIAITVLIIDTVNRRYEEKQRVRGLKEELIRQAGSSVHATAVTAIDAMRKRGWLGRDYGDESTLLIKDHDALLKNADLSNTDLHDADLIGVNLSKTNLWGANLSGANLRDANLEGSYLWNINLEQALLRNATLEDATLWNANLRNANMGSSNFRNAKLRNADLRNTYLRDANLAGAELENANLCGASLRNADLRGARMYLDHSKLGGKANLAGTLIDENTKFDETTILPDGTNWSPERDLAEFGAETREIVNAQRNEGVSIYTFANGTQRRWKLGEGWLD